MRRCRSRRLSSRFFGFLLVCVRSMTHATGDFLNRSPLGSGRCGRLRARVRSDFLLEGGDFLFVEEALFLKAYFFAAFVAIPEDKEQYY